MSRKHRILAALALASLAYSSPASACRVWQSVTPFLHETLTPDIPGDFAAKVEIITSIGPPDIALEARIIEVLRGDFTATQVKLAYPFVITSCDGYPQVGDIGILVGYVKSASQNEVVVDLVRAPSQLERQATPLAQED